MNQKRIKNWETIREKGPWRYALIHGTIWGIFVVTFMLMVDIYITKENIMLSNLLK